MSPLFRSLKRALRQPHVQEFLLWCLPALAIGLVVRVVLTVQMPYGLFHTDTPDFLETPYALLFDHKFELHAKKTFLVPALFTIPFLLHIPALIFIPLMQHAMGLGLVAITGLLCRFWFARWKWFIVPITLLVAVNPPMLWYERTLMAETTFVFCTALLALAGTLYSLWRTRGYFIFLCVALVLEAGARPEGKLLFGFGLLLLVLLHRRQIRTHWPRVAILLVLAVTMHFLTRTAQAGLLLYTSVARLTPTELQCAPGFDPYIAPLRADLVSRWEARPSFPKVRDRRVVAEAVANYLKDRQKSDPGHTHRGVNDFCLKLARETCQKNLLNLPVLVYHKFRFTANDSPSGKFDNEWVFDRQQSAYEVDKAMVALSKGVTGRRCERAADFEKFVRTHYRTVGWFNTWIDAWDKGVDYLRLPDTKYPESGFYITYPGVPLYFLLATAGLLITMFRKGTLQPLHVAWGLTLLGLFFTIILTANTKPRFRFVFEPFWFIYIGLLLESLLIGLHVMQGRPLLVIEPEEMNTVEPAHP